ncbi:hypothetical protein PPUN12996_42450 [Pseudomonas putida]|nr:hypothetical protein PPUN12996_42450 [Pseudomonas putida]
MEICGGATLGYWATGKDGITSRPASETNNATTQAKFGRWMKNLDISLPSHHWAAAVCFWAGATGIPGASPAGLPTIT